MIWIGMLKEKIRYCIIVLCSVHGEGDVMVREASENELSELLE